MPDTVVMTVEEYLALQQRIAELVEAYKKVMAERDEAEGRIAELEAELEKVKKEAVYWEEAFYEN